MQSVVSENTILVITIGQLFASFMQILMRVKQLSHLSSGPRSVGVINLYCGSYRRGK